MCSFSIGQGFFVKIQKCWGAPIETSDFLQICADFDRIWHKHAGLRPVCEDRANTRETCEQKTLKKQGRAKTVRNRAKRAKIRAKKMLKKQVVRKSCENARNVRKSVRKKKPSCERCEHFIQIPLLTRKSPILPQNLHIQISDRKSHGFAQKT